MPDSVVLAEDERTTFVAVKLDAVPPTLVSELRTIFSDIDWQKTGSVTRSDLADAFDVNGICLSERSRALLFTAMERLTGGMDAPAGSPIAFEPFCRCMYPATFGHREVQSVATYATFPDSAFTAETATGLLRARRSVWALLDDPMSSSAARLTSLLVTAVVLLSTISFCVETLPGIHRNYSSEFRAIEGFAAIFFSLELTARVFCTPLPRVYFTSLMFYVDLLSVLPYFLELVFVRAALEDSSGSAILRAMRLVRIFRLIKIGRYMQWMRVFGKTLAASIAPLFMLLSILLVLLLLFSSVQYYVERGDWDDASKSWLAPDGSPSLFSTIPDTMWWGIISMAAVGYGDVVPLTLPGRLLATVMFFVGIMISAIPISIITGNFHTEYMHMKRLTALKAVHLQEPEPQRAESPPRRDRGESGVSSLVEEVPPTASPALGAGVGFLAADSSSIGGRLFTLPLPSVLEEEEGSEWSARGLDAGALARGGKLREELESASSPPSRAGGGAALWSAPGRLQINSRVLSSTFREVKEEEGNEEEEDEEVGAEQRKIDHVMGPLDRLGFSDESMLSPGRRSPGGMLPSSPSVYDLMAAARAARAAEALEARAAVRMRAPTLGDEEDGSIDDLARAAALRSIAQMALGQADMANEGPLHTEAELLVLHRQRVDASWSEPFLRTALQVIRNSRRELMGNLKSLELQSREHVNAELGEFLADVGAYDKGTVGSVLRRDNGLS